MVQSSMGDVVRLAKPDPVQLLRAHLERTKRPAYRFAEAADMDATVITRALAGERRPGLTSAMKIDRESGGDVPVGSWANFKKIQKRRKAS